MAGSVNLVRSLGRRPSPSASLGRRPSPGASLALVALLASGCSRSCTDDHPYVPYSVHDAAPPATSKAELDAAPPPEETFATAEPALVAPPGATTFSAGGLDLVAPPGREILLAVVRDFDGDTKPDALAVVRPPAKPGKPSDVGPAEIVRYAGDGAHPETVVVAPAPRTDESCTPLARLERIGPRSALAELGATCTRGASSRALYVVRLTDKPAVAFDVVVSDPQGAPTLDVDVDGADRDKDGIDDVALRLTIEGGSPPFEPGPRLSAKIAFFDRPAGASRDPDEPDRSLRAIANRATALAKSPKNAPRVPTLVEQMRQLYRAMCQEGGAPRLKRLSGGGAIACGQSKPLETAGVAEVRAFVTSGDATRAFAAARRAQVGPATKTASKTKEIEELLAQAAPPVWATKVRTLITRVPKPKGAHPKWGPLAFEASGALLVRVGGRVVRADLEQDHETYAEVQAWPMQVVSQDGKSRWLEAYHACEGVALRATFVPTMGDGDVRDVLLPVTPPLGARCVGARGDPAEAIPIAWDARGLEALVEGVPLRIVSDPPSASVLRAPLDEIPPQGSPRSPGAKAMAVATPWGVLVRTTRAMRYRAPELEPERGLYGCTIDDAATHLACVRDGRVLVATFPPP